MALPWLKFRKYFGAACGESLLRGGQRLFVGFRQANIDGGAFAEHAPDRNFSAMRFDYRLGYGETGAVSLRINAMLERFEQRRH